MEINVRQINDVSVVNIFGEIIGDARFQFRDCLNDLMDQGATKIVIEAEEIPLADAVVIGMMMTIQGQVERKGGWLVLVNPGRSFMYLLAIRMLKNQFKNYASTIEAIEGLQ